jgi:RNA-binding motif X-linked protein 2
MKGAIKASLEDLKRMTSIKSTWHEDFRHSAYIISTGWNKDVNEGDIVTVMSQFGEIQDINLIKNQQTGESKGIAFVGFEDQRSTDLVVDNLNGVRICGRIIKIDHVKEYKLQGKCCFYDFVIQ